jgi:hypothetical protein
MRERGVLREAEAARRGVKKKKKKISLSLSHLTRHARKRGETRRLSFLEERKAT